MNTTTTLFIAVLASAALIGCKKEDDDPAPVIVTPPPYVPPAPYCETAHIAYVNVINYEEDPYFIYVDNVYQMVLPAFTVFDSLPVDQGNNRQFKAIQASGYVVSPSVYMETANVIQCNAYNWSFP